jgi:acetolactate synthase-1/2/3 large subunit
MRLHDMAETAPVAPSDSDIRRAAALLQTALFPVIHAGGGAAAGRAGAALTALAEKLQAPVCMTEGGRGLVSDRHPLALTTLGERAVLPHADVVLVLGSRFLNALGRPTHVSDKTRFIYVNLDENHLGAPRQEGLSICADAGLTAAALLKALADFKPYRKREQDIAKVRAWQFEQTSQVSPQNAYAAVLREALGDDGILVSELTQIGYYSNIAMPVYESGTLVTPGYQGTLGYGFPTSLGAAAGNPDRRVISITGDGGFGWGMQELSTLARYGFDVTVVVFADGRYGNVQRIQRRTFGAEFATELMNPDFGALAAAFGIPARRAETPEELAAALVRPAGARGPLLVEAVVGEMPSPWALIHPFVPPASPPPPNPLGEAT